MKLQIDFLKRCMLLVMATSVLMCSCKKEDIEDIGDEDIPKSLIAVGKQATILRSIDNGATWTKSIIPTESETFQGYDVSINDATYNNGTWIAVGGFGSGAVHKGLVLVSTDDGATWKEQASPAMSNLYDVAYCNNTFVAVGNRGSLITSPDGNNWTKVDLKNVIPDSGEKEVRMLTDIACGDNTIVIGGRIKISMVGASFYISLLIESTDGGKTWKNVKGTGGDYINDIVYSNGKFVALGDGGVMTREGGSWSYDNRSGKPRIHSPLLSNGDKVVATCLNSYRKQIVHKSGSDWDIKGGSFVNAGIYAMMYGNNTYVFVGSEMDPATSESYATIYTSKDDCTTWKSGRESLGDKLKGRNYAFRTGVFVNGNFVIAGDQERMPGTPTMIFTSKDGMNWTESSVPALSNEEHITKILKGN